MIWCVILLHSDLFNPQRIGLHISQKSAPTSTKNLWGKKPYSGIYGKGRVTTLSWNYISE